ncbi:RPEL repeat protein [Aspergillus sp. HF37]|nr:RPEL repeat protein [Aspergillus sp. HF37]
MTDLDVDESSISAPPLERRSSLEKHLLTRPEPQDLKDRHILLDSNVSPSLQGASQNLVRRRTSDSLKKNLERRPDRDALIERNILPSVHAAPALQANAKELERSMRADSLEHKIQNRPQPEELIAMGVLEAGEDPRNVS